MEKNDDNSNEELDFDSVQTLAEMKKERFDKTGGDPMHELNEHTNTSNNVGSQNADYNDLTNLHKTKIRDNYQNNEYDNNNYNQVNNQSENQKSSNISLRKIIWTIIFITIIIGIISAVIRFVVAYKMGKELYDNSQMVVDNSALTDLNIKQYNSEFVEFDGDKAVSGANIKMLLKNVNLHNESNEDMQIGININASNSEGINYTGIAYTESDINFIVSDLIDTSNTYSVKCKYDEDGYVNEIEIIEN